MLILLSLMGIALSKIYANFEVSVFDYPMCDPQCVKVIRSPRSSEATDLFHFCSSLIYCRLPKPIFTILCLFWLT